VNDQAHATWKRIRNQAGPYPPEAYAFVQEGLRYTVEKIREHDAEVEEHGRHVTGQELCHGLRDFAQEQFGWLARTVLAHWHIHRTEDFGRIVFAMVEAGVLRKTEEDSIKDFTAVFDFDEAFEPLSVN